MAYDFKFSISLVATHPSMDLSFLTERLGKSPKINLKSGDMRTFKSGLQRAATVSVWEADLHGDADLDSEEISFSECLRGCLPTLTPHRIEFSGISEKGNVALNVIVNSNSNHSVVIVEPDIFESLSNMSISLDIQFFAIDEAEAD